MKHKTIEEIADELMQEAKQHLLNTGVQLAKLNVSDQEYLTFQTCCGNLGDESRVRHTDRYKEIMRKLEEK